MISVIVGRSSSVNVCLQVVVRIVVSVSMVVIVVVNLDYSKVFLLYQRKNHQI